MTDVLDIGGGHVVAFYKRHGGDDTIVGLIHHHLKPDNTGCSGGSVLFDIPANEDFPDHAKWTLVSLEPLHLEPSLLCVICGSHGFIRDGLWVPA
jgi:hypothetical protein